MTKLKTSAYLIFGIVTALVQFPSTSAPFKQAQIKNIVQGNEVYINKQIASINATARSGQTLSTGKSRAELLFDRSAIGFLGQSSLITLGSECFKLNNGRVLVNGNQPACIGSSVLGVRGTTYVLAATTDDTYTLSVLNGEAVIGSSEEIPPFRGTDILSLYPRVNTIVGLNATAYANNAGGQQLGGASGLILGGGSALIPLSQRESKSILYSNNFANTNFDGFWGGSTELGYQWYDPSTGSITGLFAGYDGFKQPGCFHSQIALGGSYQFKNRWSIGANGGIKADECPSSSSYAALQVAAPIGQIGDNSIELALSPYLVTGIGEDFAGGRASLEVPVNNNLTLSAYGQYDGLFNTTIGGMISYRFGLSKNGALINDPNHNSNPELIADNDETTKAGSQSTGPQYVRAGEQVVLNNQGAIIARSLLNQEAYQEIVVSLLDGQNPLPEGVAIYNTFKKLYATSNNAVMAATGAFAMNRFTRPYPRMRGADNLFIPQTRLPQASSQRPVPPSPPSPPSPPGPEPDSTPNEIFVFGNQ